jgi:hypothetical protein
MLARKVNEGQIMHPGHQLSRVPIRITLTYGDWNCTPTVCAISDKANCRFAQRQSGQKCNICLLFVEQEGLGEAKQKVQISQYSIRNSILTMLVPKQKVRIY